MFPGHVFRPVVRFRGGGNVNVGVSIVSHIDLVTLAEVFDDVQVDPGRFHEAVLQQPAVRLTVGVTLLQYIFQGGLKKPNPCQH